MDRGTFLCARDPSIRSVHLHTRKCLKPSFERSEGSMDEESKCLDINVRMKRSEIAECYEVEGNTIRCVLPASGNTSSRSQDEEITTKVFTFTHIFPAEVTQQELFDSVMKKKVFGFINGFNTNLLTYGTSGSGKTYTLVGTDQEPGMIPQSLEYLFQTLKSVEVWPLAKFNSATKQVTWLEQLQQDREILHTTYILEHPAMSKEIDKHRQVYERMKLRMAQGLAAQLVSQELCIGLWVSCAQIYNEQVFDLLDPTEAGRQKTLRVYNNQGATYIKNLSQVYVSSGIEAYLVLQFGLCNASYASTALNEHSSRSHTLFQITMVQCTEQPSRVYRVNHLTFCDLAGSERAKKTRNVGSRFKESTNINNSLVVLGRCITAVRAAQRAGSDRIVAPFRESKLTQLFHNALRGAEEISMIVNITPEPHMVHETLHSLNFSAIAKEIQVAVCKPKTRREPDSNLQTQLNCAREALRVQEAKEEEALAALRTELLDKFKVVLAESKERQRQEYEQQLQDLREEVAELRRDNLSDSSVIDVDSFDEKVADLSVNTKYSRSRLLERYELLYNEVSDMKIAHEFERVKWAKRSEELQQQVQALTRKLHEQKVDIIKLEDTNQILNLEVECSIRYSSAVVRQLEGEGESEDEEEDYE